jgi:hypothetical protein
MKEPDGRSPIEILLVEDNPGDVRLTREILKEGRIISASTPSATALRR